MPGAILVVGSIVVCSTLTIGLAATGGAAVAARRAAGAADNAAIAAEVAEASGARLAACEAEDLEAFVTVEVSFAGLVATARARAGPPRGSVDSG